MCSSYHTHIDREWLRYLSNTDEDDEDGGRAAVGPLQVLAASIFRKHPPGDELLELFTTPHLPVTIGPVIPATERFAIAVHGKRLLLLEVDLLHHSACPGQQITESTVSPVSRSNLLNCGLTLLVPTWGTLALRLNVLDLANTNNLLLSC